MRAAGAAIAAQAQPAMRVRRLMSADAADTSVFDDAAMMPSLTPMPDFR